MLLQKSDFVSVKIDLLVDDANAAFGGNPPRAGSNGDYAVVRLVEPLAGAEPFPVNPSVPVAAGDRLIVVTAHPVGMAREVDNSIPVVQPCTVRRAPVSSTATSFYRADCDATGSSSGGMHLSRVGGELVFRGITITTGPWQDQAFRGAPYDEQGGSVTTALGTDAGGFSTPAPGSLQATSTGAAGANLPPLWGKVPAKRAEGGSSPAPAVAIDVAAAQSASMPHQTGDTLSPLRRALHAPPSRQCRAGSLVAPSEEPARWLQVRRQHPVGRFIGDFVCLEAKLIIEVDGIQHRESVEDVRRTEALFNLGFKVIRIDNDRVRSYIDAVCDENSCSGAIAEGGRRGIAGGNLNRRNLHTPFRPLRGHLPPQGGKVFFRMPPPRRDSGGRVHYRAPQFDPLYVRSSATNQFE